MRKILFVLGKDVHNKPAYKIYRECLKRGYEVDLYATTLEDGHINIFWEAKSAIRHINTLTEEQISLYDYIFSAVPIYGQTLFRDAHKYIFLNPSSSYLDDPYFSGDFVFTVRDISRPLVEGEQWPVEVFNLIRCTPGMATGGAHLEKSEIENREKTKKILFIDAGHFPFGTKRELAEYVIHIAEACPDYEVSVKPRYLPGDEDTTHKNKENLYEYLDNRESLPPNLALIRKHTDLWEELANVDLVICPEATTSYVETILADKNIIIFTGFPNQESILWNADRAKLFCGITGNLSCRVRYQDIFEYLPQGFKVDAGKLQNILYKTQNVAEDIVDAMEYIYVNFISKDIFPKEKYYKSDSYLDEMQPDYSLTWEDIIHRRYRLSLYDYAASQIVRLYISGMDCSEILEYINGVPDNNFDKAHLEELIKRLQEKLYHCYIQNSAKMMKTAYSPSLLCLAYFKENRFDEFKPDELKCGAYYAYCKAKIKFDSGDYEGTLNCLKDYFDEVDNNMYEISHADNEGVIVMAHYYKGAALFHLNRLQEAEIHLSICDKAWDGKHKKAAEYLRLIEEKS